MRLGLACDGHLVCGVERDAKQLDSTEVVLLGHGNEEEVCIGDVLINGVGLGGLY